MVTKLIRSKKMLLTLFMVAVTAAVAGMAGPACAALHPVTWTTQEDFEHNASTTDTPTTRTNIDTSTTPGDITIGMPKLSGAEITCSTSDKIYTIGAERPSVAVIDVSTMALLHIIPLPGRASGIVYNSVNNKIYVGAYSDSKVWVIDGNTDAIVNTITVGRGAYPVAYNPTNNKIYIANASDHTVSIMGGISDTVIATVAVVAGPYTATYDENKNKVYITNKYNHSVSIVDGVSDSVSIVSIEPVVGLISGLRIDAGALSIVTADKMRLKFNYHLLPSQKIEFQIRTANDLDLLDIAEYVGPDGTANTWYEAATSGVEITTEIDGSKTASIELNNAYERYAELQVKLTSDETGSPILHSVTLNYETYPDLITTDISASAAAATSGSAITVSATVANVGHDAAGAFMVGVSLTDSNGKNYICDSSIASLATDASDTVTIICTVPTALPAGHYTLEACADYTNQVVEISEANNCKGDNFEITRPDLIITSVSPDFGSFGKPITLTTTVKNTGTASATSFKVEASIIDGTGIKASIEREVTSLAAGDSDTANITWTLPATLPAGNNYKLKACADPVDLVLESSGDNNCKEIDFRIIQPDLTITNVSGPTAGLIGKTITVSTTVTNIGTDSAANFKVGISLIKGAVKTTFCERTVAFIASGASDTASTICTIPATTAVGSYTLEAFADYTEQVVEILETNNSKLSPNPITIGQPFPDLIISMTSTNGPTATIGSNSIVATTTVTNQGNDTAGSFKVGLYLTNADNGAKTFLCERTISSLADGKSSSAQQYCSVPAMPTGEYYIEAVADYTNTVAEGNETNNWVRGNAISIFSVQPDLKVKSVVGSVGSGGYQYTVTIKNYSNTLAPNSRTGIYLSTDATISREDYFGAEVNTYSVPAGGSIVLSGSSPARIPDNLPPGNYYMGAIADLYNYISESDENNNAGAGSPQYLHNDLVVYWISGSVANGKLTYSVTIKNRGNAIARSCFTGIYLSSDATITTADYYCGDTFNSGPILGQGDSIGYYSSLSTATGTCNLPYGAPLGTYYVGAITNRFTYVPESNMENNSKAGNQVTK